MAIKIEIVGNALVCTDTVSTEIIISQPSKDVWYKEDKLQIGKIQFYDANGLKGENRISEDFPFILLSDAVDDTLTAFNEATFRNFAITNLGL